MDTAQTSSFTKRVAADTRRSNEGFPRKLLLLGFLALCLAAVGWLLQDQQDGDQGGVTGFRTVTIGSVTWQLIGTADTPTARERGLSFVPELQSKNGLLFVFETPGQYAFWMKDMLFPIDIIFLSDGTVVRVAAAREPNDLTPILPPSPINQVLEVNAGEAAGIQPGDQALFE